MAKDCLAAKCPLAVPLLDKTSHKQTFPRCGLRWVELEAGGVCHWGTHGRMQCGQSLNA